MDAPATKTRGRWLVQGGAASALSNTCCVQWHEHRAACVLDVVDQRQHQSAALTRVAWQCPHTLHSQWLPRALLHDMAETAAVDEKQSCWAAFVAANTRVAVMRAPRIGRFCVARECIDVGANALEATAFAVVLKQALVRSHCHWCLRKLVKKAFQCGQCQVARYCSTACLEADSPVHDPQCRGLSALAATSPRFGAQTTAMDEDSVRLALAVLSMEDWIRTRHVLSELSIASCVEVPAWHQMAVPFILQHFDARNERLTGPLTGEHIALTLRRIQSNAHPLVVDGMVTLGLGVFPEAAMSVNHSCLPNVVPSFDARSRTLRFHAIRDIPAGYTVEYAYVDVVGSRERRQELLLNGFGFDCKCFRCTKEQGETNDCDTKNRAYDQTKLEQRMIDILRLPQRSREELKAFHEAHESQFRAIPELEMQYQLVNLQQASSAKHWRDVIAHASGFLSAWTAAGLSLHHPTLEAIYRQLASANQALNHTDEAAKAIAQVASLRTICGFETLNKAMPS